MSEKPPSNPFLDMFQQFGKNLNLPQPDISSVVDYHRKNIEALQKATQASSSGAQTMMSKQREALEEALAEITEIVQGASQSQDPSKMVADQIEFAKKSFDTTIKNATEMNEILKESGSESFNILKDRMEESIAEIRDSMSKKE